MRRIALLLTLAIVVVACKSETKDAETGTESNALELANDEKNVIKQIRGEFIYVDDGAVLKGNSFIYGVMLNDMAEELKNRVEPVKKDVYDMVPVIVKGHIMKKQEGTEGWDEILTITEIVDVSKTPAEADIKIEDKKN